MDYGSRIKEIRESKGITQQDLALLSDVSQGNLSAIEKGRSTPKMDTLYQILKALNYSIEDFYIEVFEDTKKEKASDTLQKGELSDYEKWLQNKKSTPYLEFAYRLYKKGYSPQLLERIKFTIKD